MSRRLRQLADVAHEDPKLEEMRRDHRAAIAELQTLPLAGAVIKRDVTLQSGVATPVPHGLGRIPNIVIPSVPRGAVSAGFIVEVRDGKFRRDQYITLTASGYGATITIDLTVA
jgi:hypothetical protein